MLEAGHCSASANDGKAPHGCLLWVLAAWKPGCTQSL